MSPRDASVEHMVCLNHPDRPAETKCTTCFKPLCADCVMEIDGNVFCSLDCAQNYNRSRTGMERFQESKRREARRRWTRRALMLVVLAAIAGGAYWYLNRQDPQALGSLQRAAGNLAERGRELGEAADPVARMALAKQLNSLEELWNEGRFADSAQFFTRDATYRPFNAAQTVEPAALLTLLQTHYETGVQFKTVKGWTKVPNLDDAFMTAVDVVLTGGGTGGPRNQIVRLQFGARKIQGAWRIAHVRQLSELTRRGT